MVSPSYDERKLFCEHVVVAKPAKGDGAEAVEDEKEDEEEQDGAGVQHDTLRSVELHGAGQI